MHCLGGGGHEVVLGLAGRRGSTACHDRSLRHADARGDGLSNTGRSPVKGPRAAFLPPRRRGAPPGRGADTAVRAPSTARAPPVCRGAPPAPAASGTAGAGAATTATPPRRGGGGTGPPIAAHKLEGRPGPPPPNPTIPHYQPPPKT